MVLLYPVGPHPAAGLACAVCRGPVRPGCLRCYQCEGHDLLGHGLLADAVVPISYAVKGTALAEALWRYKSWPKPSAPAQASVRALMGGFLNDHGACVWRHAAMPPADRLAVVPTGCGRPGPHPLLRLASPGLRLPLSPLAIRHGRQGRDLDVHRFWAGPVPGGASVLLLDDTWVSGASAQSAAAALKLAGAGHVAIVVLGRHVNPADPRAGPLLAGLVPLPYNSSICAVHLPAAAIDSFMCTTEIAFALAFDHEWPQLAAALRIGCPASPVLLGPALLADPSRMPPPQAGSRGRCRACGRRTGPYRHHRPRWPRSSPKLER